MSLFFGLAPHVMKTIAKNPVAEAAAAFEPEFLAGLTRVFEELIVFNQVLGLKIATIHAERVTASLAMRRELLGVDLDTARRRVEAHVRERHVR